MKNSRTPYVILGMLSIQPNLSGYELHKVIEDNFGSFWSESYGQIYPTLKRLAVEGLINPSMSISTSKKRRQAYALTDAGRVFLREWLARPFQDDPPRNEFLLKLFFGGEAAPGTALKHVRELLDRNRRVLAGLQEIENIANAHPSQNPNKQYWMLTLGLGLTLTSATLAWGESALAQLAATEATATQTPLQEEGNLTANDI
jgi:DNA-binding PadR family transcriptional regulator